MQRCSPIRADLNPDPVYHFYGDPDPNFQCHADSVSDPYSFFTDPDPDPEGEAGDQYGSGSNPDQGL